MTKRIPFVLGCVCLALLSLCWAGPLKAQLPTPPRLVVGSCLDDTISLVDARTIRVVGRFEVGPDPAGMALSPNRKELAVVQPKKSWLSIVDMSTQRASVPLAYEFLKSPACPVYSRDGARLYVLDTNTCNLIELHVPSYKFVRSVELKSFKPTRMVVSLDGTRIYVAHPEVGVVSVVDAATFEFLGEHRLADAIGGIALLPNGQKLIAALPGSCEVGIFDTATFKQIDSVPVGQGAAQLKLSAKGFVVCINSISNDVSIFDVNHPGGRFRVAVGVQPRELLFSPDGTMCYVANYATSDVSVINMKEGRQIGRLLVGKGPTSLAWIP